MGVFSFMCAGGCGHPLLSPDVTNEVNAWMADGVAVTPGGGVLAGSYDGYGRLDGSDFAQEEATAWHRACWEVAGRPGDYRGESDQAEDQGWFFDEGDHDMPDPRGLRPEAGPAATGQAGAKESLGGAGVPPEDTARFLPDREAPASHGEAPGCRDQARILRAERDSLALRLRDSEVTALKAQAEVRRLRDACASLNRSVEQILAGALGYPKYGDVDTDPPGNRDDYVTGDHTAESLAMQAAGELAALRPLEGIAGRTPPSARLRVDGPGGPADWTSWPNPDDPGEVSWRLRYGRPDRADLMFAADVMGAYAHLFSLPRTVRNQRIQQVTAARDEQRAPEGGDDA